MFGCIGRVMWELLGRSVIVGKSIFWEGESRSAGLDCFDDVT